MPATTHTALLLLLVPLLLHGCCYSAVNLVGV
jgi:hypothetical protein